MSKPALGRGLSALLGGGAVSAKPAPAPAPSAAPGEHVRPVAIASVHPCAFQPRKDFAADALRELADSIQAQGIIPDIQVAQGDEANVPKLARPSEADLRGHLSGEPVPTKRTNAPVIKPAAGTKYDDFQLAYALDLLRGKMTVASATTLPPAKAPSSPR